MRLPVVLVLCSLVGAVASAQTDSQSQPPAQPKDFASAKAQHLARLQTELACVQAATTFDAMRTCMPRPPGGHMGPPPDQQK
jgi:hypothetical protein